MVKFCFIFLIFSMARASWSVTSIFLDKSYHLNLAHQFRTEVTAGNRLVLREDSESFSHILQMIKSAKQNLWITNMFFRCDNITKPIFTELKKAAQRNVDVRLVLDGVMSQLNRKECVTELEKAKVKVLFVEPGFSIVFEGLPIQQTVKSFHSKYWIKDCSEILISGGNVIDSQVAADDQNSGYRDTSLTAIGPMARSGCRDFSTLWQELGKADHDLLNLSKQNERYISNEIKLGLRGTEALMKKQGLCYFLHQGIHGKEHIISNFIKKIIEDAQSNVELTTLYDFNFTYDDEAKTFIELLSARAQDGVWVKLMLNGMNGAWTPAEGINNFEKNSDFVTKELIKIYKKRQRKTVDSFLEFLKSQPLNFEGWFYKKFNHNKILQVDNIWSMVGTHNLDRRSFNGNYEVISACIDDKLNKEMSEMIKRDLENSVKQSHF